MAKRKPASAEVLEHGPIDGQATALVPGERSSSLDISFSPTLAEIAAMKEKYSQLTADTPEGYEQVKDAIRVLVPLRTSVDARRLQLGEHFREQLRIVNSTGNRVIELLKEIEEPLKAKKRAVDEAEEKAAFERAQAIEADQRAKEEQRLALLKAEEDRKKEEAEAELRRRQAAIDKEREEFEKQKQAFEQQQQELREAQEKLRLEQDRQQREAQARADQEQRDREYKQRIEREEREQADRLEREKKEAEERKAQAEQLRIANEKRIKEAREKAAADAIEAERQRVKREQEAAAEKAAKEKAAAERRAQRAPDVEKVRVWRDALNEVIKAAPTCKDAQAIQTVGYAKKAMIENAGILTTFINAK